MSCIKESDFLVNLLRNLTLKRKIILLMGIVVSAIPIALVAILSYSYYLFGVEAFFSTKVNNAVNETVNIAELYLKEYKEKIKIDALSAAHNLEINKLAFVNNEALLQDFIDQLSQARGLAELMLFSKNNGIIAHNFLGFALLFEEFPPEILKQLETQDVILLEDHIENRIRAVVKANSFLEDTYILVGRYVDPEILDHLRKTKGSAEEYKVLLGGLNITKSKLEIIFLCSSAFLLLISVMIARKFALYIINPLEALAQATLAIQEGDFSVRVPVQNNSDEISTLSKAFNIMTARIAEQRLELVEANNLIEARRRFIEVVMAEVSVGIIVVDPSYKVMLHNHSARALLRQESDFNNQPFQDIFPELHELLQKVFSLKHEVHIEKLVMQKSRNLLIFSVKAGVVLDASNNAESAIITFSDITELISNQKIAAWADVAKRIAHEIKNPLTPITIAAERLRTKYQAEIKSDPNSFARYIDIIISHVNNIGEMVSEFADFARIPLPVLKRHNIIAIIEESILLQKIATPHIEYRFDKKIATCDVECDRGHILRVMINLLKNAVESINAQQDQDTSSNYKGLICVQLLLENQQCVRIQICDNGIGITSEILDKILEPYVTTKKHGTGIGLTIVKKIIEDHGGKLSIKNTKEGAEASFTMTLSPSTISAA